jgi:hypothetical protein
MNPGNHPTANIEQPTSNESVRWNDWMFDVGCSMLAVGCFLFLK